MVGQSRYQGEALSLHPSGGSASSPPPLTWEGSAPHDTKKSLPSASRQKSTREKAPQSGQRKRSARARVQPSWSPATIVSTVDWLNSFVRQSSYERGSASSRMNSRRTGT